MKEVLFSPFRSDLLSGYVRTHLQGSDGQRVTLAVTETFMAGVDCRRTGLLRVIGYGIRCVGGLGHTPPVPGSLQSVHARRLGSGLLIAYWLLVG